MLDDPKVAPLQESRVVSRRFTAVRVPRQPQPVIFAHSAVTYALDVLPSPIPACTAQSKGIVPLLFANFAREDYPASDIALA
jgi:hypothetical protein